MNVRPLSTAFASSVILHGLACFSLRGCWEWPALLPDEPIFVSCMAPEPKVASRAEAPTTKPLLPDRVTASKTKPAEAASPSGEIPLRSRLARSLGMRKAEEARRNKILGPKTGSEFLSDPQKGKIFVGYFAVVKDRIHRTLRKRYQRKSGGQGTVSLSFILNSDGSIAKAGVVDKGSGADDAMKRFAVECLESSAPFGNFPKELDSSQIAFTVTVYFDEI